MTEPIKLTQEENSELVNLQVKFNELVRQLGEIHYRKKALDADLLLTEGALEDLDSERFDVVKRLQDKYGVGHVNLITGEFLPGASQ